MGSRQHKIGGVILAGVHAWGESSLERICPRPLLPVAGRPLAWYGLEWLRRGGIGEISVCANSTTDAFRTCMGYGRAMDLAITYYKDMMPRGPAGCLRDAAVHSPADAFVVVEGTILPRFDLAAALEAHLDADAALTIVMSAAGPRDGSPGGMELTGVYVASRAALEHIPASGYQDIKEAWVPRLAGQGMRIIPHIVGDNSSLRVMGLAGYLTATGQAIESLVNEEEAGGEYHRAGDAWVHKSVRVGHGLRLRGAVLIGPGAVIDDDVCVAGPAAIGPDTYIESGVILSGVSIGQRCRLGVGSMVFRCAVADGSTIEDQVIVRETVWCGPANRPQGPELPNYWRLVSGPEPATKPGEHLQESKKETHARKAVRHEPATGARASVRHSAEVGGKRNSNSGRHTQP